MLGRHGGISSRAYKCHVRKIITQKELLKIRSLYYLCYYLSVRDTEKLQVQQEGC